MKEPVNLCKVLEALVLIFFLGEDILIARSSLAFVANNSSSRIIRRTTLAMPTAEKDHKNQSKPQRQKAAFAVPLIDIGITCPNGNREDESHCLPDATSRALVSALQDSGFALVRSPLLTKDLQSNALEAASRFLGAPPNASAIDVAGDNDDENAIRKPLVEVIEHPTDPKVYAMLDSNDQFDFVSADRTIRDYVRALEAIKMDVLRHIAAGLGMSDVDFFANLHGEHNDTLRLITYHATFSEDTGNRCKEHSDYGTITLLSTDGNSGLELFQDGNWLPVPFVEGALVINVGSLLAGWTNGSLKATLHRVAGPASANSCSDRKVLLEAVHRPRTSVAFFADPNRDVSESLQATQSDFATDPLEGMSVAEYIRWRSGGDGAERSGVSFTEKESEIINKTQ